MLPDTMAIATYSMNEIKSAWDKYQHHRVLRVLKDGEWSIMSLDKVSNIPGSRAEVVKISQVMSFPKYLERNYGD